MEKVLTYGTLRSGQRNHRLMSESHYVGEASINAKIVGTWGTDIPLIVPDENETVSGEVYEVTPHELKSLDYFEGIAHGLYSRERVHTTDGEPCWVYFPSSRLIAESSLS